MTLKEQLSGRIGKTEISQFCREYNTYNISCKEDLYSLIFDNDKRVADNATWIMSHMIKSKKDIFQNHINDLITEAMRTDSESKCRLILTMLRKLKFSADSIDGCFLDFCLSSIVDCSKPVGIRAMCIYVAYEQCRFYPELIEELRLTLDLLDNSGQQAAVRSAKHSTLQKISKMNNHNV